MWIVRLALRRPYTFVVAALVLLLLTPFVLLRTPTDIFPSVDIPVVSAVWMYNGLSAQEIEQRIVFNHERMIATLVDDIEHIESTAYNGAAVVKVFLRPGASAHRGVCPPPATPAEPRFSRSHFLLSARRHRESDHQFRSAGAVRRPDRRPRSAAEPCRCRPVGRETSPRPRRGRREGAATGRLASAPVRRRPRQGLGAWLDPARRGQCDAVEPQRQQPGAAHVLAQPQEGRPVPRQRPHAAACHGFPLRPECHPRGDRPTGKGRRPSACQPGHVAAIHRSADRQPLQRHAGNRRPGRHQRPRSGRSAPRYQAPGCRSRKGVDERKLHRAPRPGANHGFELPRPRPRADRGHGPDLSAAGRQLPELARPVHHPHRTAGCAGRRRVGPLSHLHDPQRARTDGSNHEPGGWRKRRSCAFTSAFPSPTHSASCPAAAPKC